MADSHAFDELLAHTQDTVALIDEAGAITFVNRAVKRRLGYEPDDLVGETLFDYVHTDDVDAVRRQFDRMLDTEEFTAERIEYRVRDSDGDWVWFEGRMSNSTDPDLDGYVVSARDITDRHRRERQLTVMDTLLRHNIRNDMSIILGNADRIANTAPEAADPAATIQRTGEDLLESAEKQRWIIDTLVDQPSARDCDLGVVVGESIATARDRYPEASISVSGADSVPARAVDQLNLALTELIENAITHQRAAVPSVEVTLARTDGHPTVTVADEATPIPEMDARVLRGDHEIDALSHGSGLGLWLVYWAVELSGGRIAVDTDSERGNRVTITLPAVAG